MVAIGLALLGGSVVRRDKPFDWSTAPQCQNRQDLKI
jgi:hypothetical protein